MEYVTEDKLKGILGALLGSLVGGVLFFILYKLGFFAAITGTVGVVLAMVFYQKFAKKMSKFGVWISLILSLVLILVSYYYSLALIIYDTWKADYVITFKECVHYVFPVFFDDSETFLAILGEIGLAILFWAIGGITEAVRELKRIKLANESENINSIKYSASDYNYVDNSNTDLEEPKENPLDM